MSTPCTCDFTGSLPLLKEAVKKLLADRTFYLPSPPAAAALATAKLLVQWLDCVDNLQPASTFSNDLVTTLKTCFE